MVLNELRRQKIEKEIEDLNIQFKTQKFERYTDHEKAEYIEKQIKLFTELRDLVGLVDKFRINGFLVALEISLKKVKP